ncbi:MAG: alanine racemase [Oscillospiraceae bacterium]|nr:alanine racemase [Oscillospiraceae bacterium]
MASFLHRSWVEIDLDNIEHNIREIRSLIGSDVELMACVKADAYGHGSGIVSLLLERVGVDSFGVSNINEAEVLRKAGVKKPILILGFTPPELAGLLTRLDVTQTILNLEYATQLSEQAKAIGATIKADIKVDTGMSRIGFLANDILSAANQIQATCELPGLKIEGIFTHFAVADELTPFGKQYTEHQHAQFAQLISRLAQQDIRFKSVHCCNSAATLFYPEMHHTLVRVGIMIYGLPPSENVSHKINLKPAMALKSAVSQVKELPIDTSISYGARYTTDSVKQIATLPLGYADGYPRGLGNKARAYIHGTLVPIVGTICMDQLMIDVTGLDVKQDDEVTLFGGDSPIGLTNLAGLTGTICYELCCGISRRIPRVYIKDKRILDAIDYSLLV